MKNILPSLIVVAALCLALPAQANDSMLPFPVKVGGKSAVLAKPTDSMAKIADPVAADAELEVEISADVPMLIINAFTSDAAGTAKEGAQPAVIFANNTKKVKLDATMDKKKLEPGYYLLNIVADGKTSRVLLQVK